MSNVPCGRLKTKSFFLKEINKATVIMGAVKFDPRVVGGLTSAGFGTWAPATKLPARKLYSIGSSACRVPPGPRMPVGSQPFVPLKRTVKHVRFGGILPRLLRIVNKILIAGRSEEMRAIDVAPTACVVGPQRGREGGGCTERGNNKLYWPRAPIGWAGHRLCSVKIGI